MSSSSLSSSSRSSSSSSATPGDVTWGHHTSVAQEYDENFTGYWSTDNGVAIDGTPGTDGERLAIDDADEYTVSEPWYVGNKNVEILKDDYGTDYGTDVDVAYKTGSSRTACEADTWNATDFETEFSSDGWVQIKLTSTIVASGDRGIFAGGASTSEDYEDIINYITISTTGNATDFGDLTLGQQGPGANSNSTNERGTIAGGRTTGGGNTNVIGYITINSPSNATDFGDLTNSRRLMSGTSNATNERGVYGAGGYTTTEVNIIDYITINSIGNATDFGDAINNIRNTGATSNAENDRGVFTGGRVGGNYRNYIQYITISTTGNTTDAADLTQARQNPIATSNGTNERAVCGGGRTSSANYVNTIDYFTINSISNATDFGDLTVARNSNGAVSNGTNERGTFAGGGGASGNVDTIDYITINSTGNATDFGDLTIAYSAMGSTSNA